MITQFVSFSIDSELLYTISGGRYFVIHDAMALWGVTQSPARNTHNWISSARLLAFELWGGLSGLGHTQVCSPLIVFTHTHAYEELLLHTFNPQKILLPIITSWVIIRPTQGNSRLKFSCKPLSQTDCVNVTHKCTEVTSIYAHYEWALDNDTIIFRCSQDWRGTLGAGVSLNVGSVAIRLICQKHRMAGDMAVVS